MDRAARCITGAPGQVWRNIETPVQGLKESHWARPGHTTREQPAQRKPGVAVRTTMRGMAKRMDQLLGAAGTGRNCGGIIPGRPVGYR